MSLRTACFAADALGWSQPTALLEKEALQSVGRADQTAVMNGTPQMRDAGLEVVLETGHRRGILPCEAPYDGLAQDASIFRRWGLIGRLGSFLEVGPDLFGQLLHEVAHPVRQAALT